MPGEVVEDEAFVSLVTNNSYSNGALVLGYSLRRVNTTRKLVLLVAKEVLEPTRERLARVWDHLEIVDLLDSGDTTNLALLTRPELGITFTKIHCWNLTQYRKCVFLDADTLVIQNCDELFERDELSAVPDIGWPDCFNSGVFVFEPSRATYEALLEYAVQNGSFDGGDQGLLNSFFSNWRTADISRHLSFIYNMNSNASYTYAPAFQQFGRDVKIVHFIGPLKPWHYTYNTETGRVYTPSGSQGYIPHERTFLQLWWDIYVTFVRPEMRESDVEGIDVGIADMYIDDPIAEITPALQDLAHQQAWENGEIDYRGRDKFENIQKRIEEFIGVLRDPTDMPTFLVF